MKPKNPKTHQKPDPKPGRQRLDFPTFGSMGQAAKMIGAPLNLLKAAKLKGCKAFLTSSRVDTGILIPFLFEMIAEKSDIPAGFSSWKDYGEAQRAQQEAIELQRKQGRLMEVQDAKRQAGEAWGWLFAELERMERESPPAWAGLPAVELGKRIKAQVEKIRTGAKAKFEEVGG